VLEFYLLFLFYFLAAIGLLVMTVV